MNWLWFVPLHSGLAGHNWFAQILVIMLIAGVWLFISGNIARRSANRTTGSPEAGRAAPRVIQDGQPEKPAWLVWPG